MLYKTIRNTKLYRQIKPLMVGYGRLEGNEAVYG